MSEDLGKANKHRLISFNHLHVNHMTLEVSALHNKKKKTR